jgi:hypothetical protein
VPIPHLEDKDIARAQLRVAVPLFEPCVNAAAKEGTHREHQEEQGLGAQRFSASAPKLQWLATRSIDATTINRFAG